MMIILLLLSPPSQRIQGDKTPADLDLKDDDQVRREGGREGAREPGKEGGREGGEHRCSYTSPLSLPYNDSLT